MEGEKKRSGWENTVDLQYIGKEAESFRSFPKSRFLILNSADMFSRWELKTFIWRLEFLVRFQNQKRTIVSEQVGN